MHAGKRPYLPATSTIRKLERLKKESGCINAKRGRVLPDAIYLSSLQTMLSVHVSASILRTWTRAGLSTVRLSCKDYSMKRQLMAVLYLTASIRSQVDVYYRVVCTVD